MHIALTREPFPIQLRSLKPLTTTMYEATYLVATRLIEAMELDTTAKGESVKHSDWFNGLVDHLIEHEKAILA